MTRGTPDNIGTADGRGLRFLSIFDTDWREYQDRMRDREKRPQYCPKCGCRRPISMRVAILYYGWVCRMGASFCNWTISDKAFMRRYDIGVAE